MFFEFIVIFAVSAGALEAQLTIGDGETKTVRQSFYQKAQDGDYQ
jgi:hypothetical protein